MHKRAVVGSLSNRSCLVTLFVVVVAACAPLPTEFPDSVALCVDDASGETRHVVTPQPGALSILEWMANPIGDDSTLEWIEVRANEAVDLATVVARIDHVETATQKATSDIPPCDSIKAGELLVFARAPELFAESRTRKLTASLPNSGVRVLQLVHDDTRIDEIVYTDSREGFSAQLDNDGVECVASVSLYDSKNTGTPGVANSPCPGAPISADECIDDDGTARPIHPPRPQELQFSEWMLNPKGDDAKGEWFELHAMTWFDLNGITIVDSSGSSFTIASTACIEASKDSLWVAARSADVAINGGVAGVDFEFPFSLNNSNEVLRVLHNSIELDIVEVKVSEEGVAEQVDGEGVRCNSRTQYGDDQRGTPGLPNLSCRSFSVYSR